MLPAILWGEFDTDFMNGTLVENFKSDLISLSSQYEITKLYNAYTHITKPIMIDLIGKILLLIDEDLVKSDTLAGSEAIVYHISPMRIGFLIKSGLSIENVLPNLHAYFNPVKPFEYDMVTTSDVLW
jgi:hypothetical protein